MLHHDNFLCHVPDSLWLIQHYTYYPSQGYTNSPRIALSKSSMGRSDRPPPTACLIQRHHDFCNRVLHFFCVLNVINIISYMYQNIVTFCSFSIKSYFVIYSKWPYLPPRIPKSCHRGFAAEIVVIFTNTQEMSTNCRQHFSCTALKYLIRHTSRNEQLIQNRIQAYSVLCTVQQVKYFTVQSNVRTKNLVASKVRNIFTICVSDIRNEVQIVSNKTKFVVASVTDNSHIEGDSIEPLVHINCM